MNQIEEAIYHPGPSTVHSYGDGLGRSSPQFVPASLSHSIYRSPRIRTLVLFFIESQRVVACPASLRVSAVSVSDSCSTRRFAKEHTHNVSPSINNFLIFRFEGIPLPVLPANSGRELGEQGCEQRISLPDQCCVCRRTTSSKARAAAKIAALLIVFLSPSDRERGERREAISVRFFAPLVL